MRARLVLALLPALAVPAPAAAALAVPALAAAALAVPAPPAAAASHWLAPVPGPPTRLFRLGPDPFAAGQHRGVDFAARGEVRAACAGRVVFSGRVARVGTVSLRCGRWRVSYAPLARVTVRRGRAVWPGAALGRAAGALHFGVRREGRRFGYVDPLPFLAGRRSPPPVLAPPPNGPRRRPPPPGHRWRRPPARAPAVAARPLAARPQPPPALAPWPVWLGLALGLTGLIGAGRLRLRSRRQEGASCRVSSTSSSSPPTPSSP